MNVRGLVRGAATVVLAGALALGATLPASAHKKGGELGTQSLASVLLKDTKGFDKNPYDFDILTAAVLKVLKDKPTSAVSVLTKGDVALTAFLPTDGAFRKLARDLTPKGKPAPKSEADVAAAVVGLGVDTVEQVLLYHVVPGATITYRQALKSNGASLTTAQGGAIKVKVVYCFFVKLGDQDPDAADPYVIKADINKGNKQIGHAINRVLRPLDL